MGTFKERLDELVKLRDDEFALLRLDTSAEAQAAFEKCYEDTAVDLKRQSSAIARNHGSLYEDGETDTMWQGFEDGYVLGKLSALPLAEELHAEVERLKAENCTLASGICNNAKGDEYGNLVCGSQTQLDQLRTAADKMKEALEHLVGSKTVDDQGRERYTMDVSPLMRTTTHNLYHAHRTAVEALSTYEQARGGSDGL